MNRVQISHCPMTGFRMMEFFESFRCWLLGLETTEEAERSAA
jgi:hypothetical protein